MTMIFTYTNELGRGYAIHINDGIDLTSMSIDEFEEFTNTIFDVLKECANKEVKAA